MNSRADICAGEKDEQAGCSIQWKSVPKVIGRGYTYLIRKDTSVHCLL